MGFFLYHLLTYFSVAFGVVIGASILSGMISMLTLQPPSYAIQETAEKMKIWAVVASIGGTIDPFREMEVNFIESQYSGVIKQILFIISAFMGAYLGAKLMDWLAMGGNSS